ncbi:protein PF14_0175 isoform X2 [Contarinia nasturtii]|uniref:protein PF14_0175 isoform X2 n=1 Tax=Contarinia nasturtii TaxID=265458 RepID=UPI0012D3A205|nr:protein PF14_0175 isoform X2 [Contarinia nasturtii]
MQEKFANIASNKTGQIKSISKYEMLYIPKSIASKRIHVKSSVVIESSSSLSLSSSNVNFNGTKEEQWSSYCIGQLVKHKFIDSGFTKFFITLIVCLLWISLVGFVHCNSNDRGDNSVIHLNESNNTTTTTVQPKSLSNHWWHPLSSIPQHKSNNGIPHQKRRSKSSMLKLNVLNGDNERSEHFLNVNHVKNISNGSFKRHQQHQRQQFGISIITRSKKTNPNASFSLDLFQQNTVDGQHVQRQKNQTLNRLGYQHDTNRIPDAIRKSLHHHHSVIKRFRAFVTKRYHFSAKTKDNKSTINNSSERIISTTATTIVSEDNITSNDQLIETPQNHHNIQRQNKIQNDSEHDDDNDDEQQPRQSQQKNNIKTTNILINQTNAILLRDLLFKKHFDLHKINEINGMNVTISSKIVHHNRKRSTDLHENEQTPTKRTSTHPFDDHFFNSKLKNYYFLYHIDNISNYNNHFNLLNSPSILNAIQFKLNKKNIQFSKRQIDNALIDATNTESDFSKYNNSQKPLHFNNHHSNRIKRIQLAKIASICLNCVNDIGDGNEENNGKINTIAQSFSSSSSSSSAPPSSPTSPMKIYILPRSLRSVDHQSTTLNADNRADDDDDNDIQEWDESTFQNSLKNYPRIAGLLGNLSLTNISDQFNYLKNQNVRPNAKNLQNNLNIITDSTNNANHKTKVTATALAKMIALHTNASVASIPFSKSSKTNNITTINNEYVMDTPIRADAASHISTNNYSPISTFEHYIKVISSRNINNRKNYYAIQTSGNKSKSLNFQNLKQQKFQRIKKQNQFIQLFATNHRFILNNTMNDNNIKNHVNDTVATTTDGHATDNKNIVINFKLKHFNLNESNCTTKNIFNFDHVNLNGTNTDAVVNAANQQQSPLSQLRQKNHRFSVAEKTKNEDTIENVVNTTKDEVPTIEKRSKVDRLNETIKLTTNKKMKKKTDKFTEKIRSSSSANSYLMRLESIKYQILMKLGLKQKPNITNTLPKHVIMETLYRADDNNVPHSNENPGRHPNRKSHQRQKQRHKQKHHPKLNKNAANKLTPPIALNKDPNREMYQASQFSNNKNDSSTGIHRMDDEKFPFNAADIFEETNDIESDDFYGRTREIIIFAERDESDNTNNSVNKSKPVETTVQLSKRTSHVNHSNENTLKQRSKCKGDDDIIENSQVRKRKRRRRQVVETTDAKETGNNNKPVILVSNEKKALEKMVVKSESTTSQTSSQAEQTQYQPLNLDFNSDTRVRRAFLWIKVDEAINNKKSPKKHKPKGLHHRNGKHHRTNFFRLWVFHIVEPTLEPNQHIKLSASKSVHVSRLGWQKLDVTSTVRQWYAYGGKTRLRFLVDCSGCMDRIKIHLFDGNKQIKTAKPRPKPNLLQNEKLNGSSDPVRPFLVIYTDPNVIKRVRRHTPDCSVAVRGQCCKQKFYVSFAELGWEDWIIAPHGYYANYCQGNCNGLRTPDNFRSYHSHVIEEYRKMNRLTGLQPCCTPLKFSSMSLIYYEENQKIIKRDLPKMVVDECGCP